MPFYALTTVPLINKLTRTLVQAWHADDAAATRTIARFRLWWEEISSFGPSFGYFAKAAKTWLVVKPDHQSQAAAAFGDTDVTITCDGRPYLGGALGSTNYVNEFVSGKVDLWSKEVILLSEIAAS